MARVYVCRGGFYYIQIRKSARKTPTASSDRRAAAVSDSQALSARPTVLQLPPAARPPSFSALRLPVSGWSVSTPHLPAPSSVPPYDPGSRVPGAPSGMRESFVY
jgi:hypothetical protein